MEHGAILRHDGLVTHIDNVVARGIESSRQAQTIPRNHQRVLVFDFHQHWARETRPTLGSIWNYRETLEQDWYAAASSLWGACAVGPLPQALAEAGCVLAPHFQMVRDEDLAAIGCFLQRGGTFVTTADFGRLTWENNVRPLPPLGAWAPLFPPPAGEMMHLKPDFVVRGQFLGDPVLGRYFWFVPAVAASPDLADGAQAGPALLKFAVGNGRVYVLTSALDRASLVTLLGHFIQ